MWYAIYDKETGGAVSYGTVVADQLPKHLDIVALGNEAPNFETHQWNPQTLRLEEVEHGSTS